MAIELPDPEEPDIWIVKSNETGREKVTGAGPGLAMALLSSKYTVLSARLW